MPGGPPPLPGRFRSFTLRDRDAVALLHDWPLARDVLQNQPPARKAPGSLLLIARTSGEPYGPRVGRFVAGRAVDVLISLPVEGGAG
jgi:hypothetical protein